jgi:hypothetical protein
MIHKLVGLLAIALSLAGCATAGVQPATDQKPNSVYQLDLYGNLDGVAFDGVGVGSSAKTHSIRIESRTDVNEMDIQTCHRFERYEDVIQTGWFHENRGFEYSYTETPGIEDNGYCIVRLAAFTKQVGAGQAYGLLLFHSPRFTLPAENICNGADGKTSGASVCQSADGLVERLKFPGQVITARTKPDGSTIPMMCEGRFIDPQTFEYKMPLGECVIEFAEVQAPNRKYVHLARGFNKTQYRGNQK